MVARYEHKSYGLTFKFDWPADWDDEAKVSFLVEAAKMGNQVSVSQKDEHLLPMFEERVSRYAQR